MNPIPPPLSELNLADSRLDRSQLEALMIEYYDILELIILSNSRGVSQSHSILWSCLCPDDHWVVDNLGCVRDLAPSPTRTSEVCRSVGRKYAHMYV